MVLSTRAKIIVAASFAAIVIALVILNVMFEQAWAGYVFLLVLVFPFIDVLFWGLFFNVRSKDPPPPQD